jgi:hypothetical protein
MSTRMSSAMAHHILSQIIGRMFLLLVSNPGMTRHEARAIAARQIAQEQRAQRKASSFTSRPQSTANAGDALLAKLFGIIQRMDARREPPPEGQPLTGELARPVSTVSAAMVRKADPEPQPGLSVVGIYDGRTTGATLLSDEEFPAAMRSPIYRNWIRSIETNERIARERADARARARRRE